jgi:hypothetical protein
MLVCILYLLLDLMQVTVLHPAYQLYSHELRLFDYCRQISKFVIVQKSPLRGFLLCDVWMLPSEYMPRQVHTDLSVDLVTLFWECNRHAIDVVPCVRILTFPLDGEWIIFGDFSLYDAHTFLDITTLAIVLRKRNQVYIRLESAS